MDHNNKNHEDCILPAKAGLMSTLYTADDGQKETTGGSLYVVKRKEVD
jgi:hypothetical protein